MDTTLFLTYFPEFYQLSTPTIEAVIARSTLKSNGFPGISEEARREYALSLLVAHTLTMKARTSDDNASRIKRVKSRSDEIEYFGNTSKLDFGLSQTHYGQELHELLDSIYCGGFLV